MGSISVTSTLAPNAMRLLAHPFPTSPYPATTHTYKRERGREGGRGEVPWCTPECVSPTFPANIMSVARLIPSTRDSRQPYKLSNLLCKKSAYINTDAHYKNITLVTELLTLIAGAFSSPFLNILYRLCTPVVVSSVTPRMSKPHPHNKH